MARFHALSVRSPSTLGPSSTKTARNVGFPSYIPLLWMGISEGFEKDSVSCPNTFEITIKARKYINRRYLVKLGKKERAYG